jgi:hypothetical protein
MEFFYVPAFLAASTSAIFLASASSVAFLAAALLYYFFGRTTNVWIII